MMSCEMITSSEAKGRGVEVEPIFVPPSEGCCTAEKIAKAAVYTFAFIAIGAIVVAVLAFPPIAVISMGALSGYLATAIFLTASKLAALVTWGIRAWLAGSPFMNVNVESKHATNKNVELQHATNKLKGAQAKLQGLEYQDMEARFNELHSNTHLNKKLIDSITQDIEDTKDEIRFALIAVDLANDTASA